MLCFYRLVHFLSSHQEVEMKPEGKTKKLIKNAKYCKASPQKIRPEIRKTDKDRKKDSKRMQKVLRKQGENY